MALLVRYNVMLDWRIWILTSNDNIVDLFSRLFHLFAIALSHILYPTLACKKIIIDEQIITETINIYIAF